MRNEDLTFYQKKEEFFNVLSHGIGLVLSTVGLFLLIVKSSRSDIPFKLVSFTLFGCSLILLYAASTFYHLVQRPFLRMRLNIIDHAAIYILIAGTYTPFTLVTLHGKLGWTLFGVTWGIAVIGVVLKIFYTGRFDKISTIAYVAMGWMIVFTIKPLLENFPIHGLYWLLVGGLAYTVGAVVYSRPSLRYNHAIFHVFVLLGSLCHFIAIYYYV
ncbi:hemolysin III family protein [Flavobacteriaceae bacterium F08102]|nr:hemolysin III family protein [Flavobacteriaceae bacterium F08102]